MLGKLLQGRYQVVQVLSAGRFCQTYIAEDTYQVDRPNCVVKHFLPVDNSKNLLPTLKQLFNREVAALKKLGNYPQVPQLLAHFEENQEFYLVQEFIAGSPLSDELKPGQKWSESQVIDLLQEVLGILSLIHRYGLIHRDVKPNNLIRRQKDRRLVLIDFGSVKQAWMQVVTVQGKTSASYAIGIPATLAIGTSGYMPTEQGRGRPRPNSDIYALGMIGIQALTGLSPTELLENFNTAEVIWQHKAQVSADLASVLNKMVCYHFKDRYQSAPEVLQALQPLAQYSHSQHSASQQPSPTQQPTATEPTVIATAVPQARPSKQDTIQVFPGNSSSPQLGSHTTDAAVPTTPNKTTLLIGIATGVASALALIVINYHSLQSPAPASKIQRYPVSIPSKNTASGNITLANTLSGHSATVWSVAISPDGQTIVSSSGDQTLKLWNLPTGELQRTLAGHADQVLSVALSPDGQTLASSSWDHTIKLWNLRTEQLRRTITGDSNEVWSVALSPDGQTLASSNGNINKLWNMPTTELRRNLSGHSDTVWSVAISPDSQTLASGSKDQTIKLWNLRTGRLLRTLSGHSSRVRSIAISPDGQTLASGSWDQTIKIWNLRTGKLLRTLSGHSAYVNTVAISPDGQILASGSDDSTIKVWNLPTGELLSTLSGHSSNVNSVTFDATGRILVSGSEDKTIKIWRL